MNGKFSGITIDGCNGVAVVLNLAIFYTEVKNSQSIQVRILGKCPAVFIDNTDGCQVYLSEESISAEFITTKSSAMNVLIPDGNGKLTENAIPEHFKTTWDGMYLVTDCTDIHG